MDKSENAHGLTVIHSAFNCPPFCSKIFCALLFFSRKRVRSYKAEVMRGACSPLAPRQTDDIRRVVSFCCLFIVMAAKKEEGDVQTYVCRQTSIRTVVLLTFMFGRHKMPQDLRPGKGKNEEMTIRNLSWRQSGKSFPVIIAWNQSEGKKHF